MNKKIIMFCFITMFMIIAISITTAVNIKKDDTKKKISPLFNIRTQKAINKEKTKETIKFIVNKFLKQRVFYIPFKEILEKINPNVIGTQGFPVTECYTCKCEIDNNFVNTIDYPPTACLTCNKPCKTTTTNTPTSCLTCHTYCDICLNLQ